MSADEAGPDIRALHREALRLHAEVLRHACEPPDGSATAWNALHLAAHRLHGAALHLKLVADELDAARLAAPT